MSELAISAPATHGQTLTLSGDKVGRFLLHKDITSRIFADDILFAWSVSHIATGLRFPFSFRRKNSARIFARGAEKLMDWDSIEIEIDHSAKDVSRACKWKVGPTPEQKQAIRDFAIECGALR